MAWTQSQYNYNYGDYSSSPHYQYLKLTASVTETVDTANNRSTLTVSVGLYHANIDKAATSSSVYVNWYYDDGSYVQGTRISTPKMSGPSSGATTTSFGTSTITVPHDSSGSASGYVLVQWATGALDYHGTSYTELGCKVTNIDLTDIIQAEGAEITAAYDFTSEDYSPSFRYSNPMGSSVTSLQVRLENYDEDALTSWKSVSKTSTSGTVSLTSSEMNALISEAGADRTATIYFCLKTVVSGQTFYSYDWATFTVAVQEGSPEVSASISKNNSAIPSATRSQFNNLIIQGKTTLNFTITATPQGDATIEGYTTVVDGVTYTTSSFSTPAFSTSGNKTWAATAVDSRAYTGSDTGTITVLPYVKPAFSNTEIYRSDSVGVFDKNSNRIWIRATRVVSPVNSGGRKNYSTMSYRYKLTTDQSYGSWISLLGSESIDGDTYSALISGTFPAASAYYFQIKIEDDIGETTILTFNTASDVVALHLGNTGRAIGIGRYADTNIARSLSVGWKTYFDDTVYLLVNGQYITLAQYIQSFISNS